MHTKDNTDVAPLLNDMFEKLAKYANGEIEASAEDYQLLEKLNLHAAKKVSARDKIDTEGSGASTSANSMDQQIWVHL